MCSQKMKDKTKKVTDDDFLAKIKAFCFNNFFTLSCICWSREVVFVETLKCLLATTPPSFLPI